MTEDKLISAKSIHNKIESYYDNGEDMLPMTTTDFIQMINDEPDASIPHENEVWVDRKGKAYFIGYANERSVKYFSPASPEDEAFMETKGFIRCFRKTKFRFT